MPGFPQSFGSNFGEFFEFFDQFLCLFEPRFSQFIIVIIVTHEDKIRFYRFKLPCEGHGVCEFEDRLYGYEQFQVRSYSPQLRHVIDSTVN